MPGEIDFTGTLPAGAHTLSIRLPYVLGDTMQVFELPDGDSDAAPVTAGGFSDEVRLNLPLPKAAPAGNAPPWMGGMGVMRLIPEALGCVLFVTILFFLNSRLFPLLRKVRFRHSR
jgi:hypothetical protein